MSEGFAVESEELLQHAANLETLAERFTAVLDASAHIVQDAEAYGLCCEWLPEVLEGRHRRQDELVAFVAENLSLAAGELRATAAAYEDSDQASRSELDGLLGELEG